MRMKASEIEKYIGIIKGSSGRKQEQDSADGSISELFLDDEKWDDILEGARSKEHLEVSSERFNEGCGYDTEMWKS